MVKITLFGLAGTGKSSTAKLVCEKLGLTYMSTGNIFRAEAKRRGLTVYEFDQLCRSDTKYDVELDDSTKKFGRENDSFFFESRLAWHFIPDSVKIKLHCEFDERVRRVVERDGGDLEDTKILTTHREEAIKERYSKLYGLDDFSDDKNFELVIDTTNTGLDEVVEIIINFVKSKQN